MKHKLLFCALSLFVFCSVSAQVNADLTDSIPEIVITGTGTQHLLKDVPVQTEVISHKILKNYAGKSISDVLSGLTSSIDFNKDDMGSQIQMNGLGNNYILILINGKRIHGDVGGQNDLDLIDPQNIEQIEIVKGASSALYGSDAIAGVINIITKKHEEGLLLENTTRTGSYGDIRQHNGIGFRSGKWSLYTNFQLQHSDGWQNTSIEDPKQTEFLITDSKNKTVNRHTNWQISERIGYEINKNIEIYTEGSTYWKRIYRPSGKYAATDVKTYDLEYHNGSVSAGGKWKLNKIDYVTLNTSWDKHAYFYNYTDTTLEDRYVKGVLDHYYPYFSGQKNLQSNQERTMVELKGVFNLPYMNRLIAGFEWRYDWLHAPMRVIKGKAHDTTEALYFQDEFNWFQPLNITAGLRLNNNEAFGFKATPKISAMLSLGDFRIRTTWSEGFKTPTPKELYYRYIREMSGTYLYLGNKNLKPQTSTYYSLSGEYRINQLSISVTSYYNNVDNMIALVTIPKGEAPAEYLIEYDPVKVRQYKNLESAKTFGVDVNLNYNITKELTIGGGYSYLDTKAQVYNTTKDILQNVVIDGMAHHKANCYITWGHQLKPYYHIGIGMYGKMSSKRYYQINGNGKGYQIWRLSTTHDFGRSKKMTYRLEAGIDNIFNYIDKTYHGLHLGTTTPGTTIYAAFTIKFSQGKKISNNYKPNLNNNYNEEN
ncbi:MAG: TonB-dependent receptor plug domain-containing protein [Phocaeicola sp.]|uniref:TonB-dependent receptor plug domain-containing protein n=1 Tax=Phocaeicola TaxID=909656 RepID=UPI00234F98B5|nr:TonB-dependent receptor [Phocaeicola oris]MCE2616374.1 TonB-dependent receptor [Phocaeicola oris]